LGKKIVDLDVVDVVSRYTPRGGVVALTQGVFFKWLDRGGIACVNLVKGEKMAQAVEAMNQIKVALQNYYTAHQTLPDTLTPDNLHELVGGEAEAILDTFHDRTFSYEKYSDNKCLIHAFVQGDLETSISLRGWRIDCAKIRISTRRGATIVSNSNYLPSSPTKVEVDFDEERSEGDKKYYDIFVGTENGIWTAACSYGRRIPETASFYPYGLQGKRITALELFEAEDGTPRRLIVGTNEGVFTKTGESGWVSLSGFGDFPQNVKTLTARLIPDRENFCAIYAATEDEVYYYEGLLNPRPPAIWKRIGLPGSSTTVFDLSSPLDRYGCQYNQCYAATDRGVYRYYPLPLDYRISYDQQKYEVVFTLQNLDQENPVSIILIDLPPVVLKIYDRFHRFVTSLPGGGAEPEIPITIPAGQSYQAATLSLQELPRDKYWGYGFFKTNLGYVPASPAPLEILDWKNIDSTLKEETNQTVSYPNPFNPECYIPVGRMKNEAGREKVRIYNLLGQLVREIECSKLSVQSSRVYWDGKNSQGLEVPAGVYFYEVAGKGVRKMVVLR
jgi:hypothetical protein